MNLIEKIQRKLTLTLYSVMYETMNQFICSSLFYKIIYVIEMLQLTYFVMHPQIHFEFTILPLEYFKQIIRYLQFNYILSILDFQYIFVILYICFGIQIVILIFLAIGANYIYHKKKIMSYTSYAFKMISLYALFSNTFLSINMMNIFVIVVICIQYSPQRAYQDCYSGINILHTTIAGIGLLIFLILQYIFISLYSEIKSNPYIPFAKSQGKHDYVKQIIKFIILIYISIQDEGLYYQYYSVILSILYLLLLILRIWEAQYFQKNIFYFVLYCDTIQFTIAILFTFHVLIDQENSDNVGLYFIIIAIPFLYNCACQFVHFKYRIIYNLGINKLNSPFYIEQYYNLLIYLIIHREILINYIYLEGAIIQHQFICIDTQCPCIEIRNIKTQQLEESLYFKLILIMLKSSINKFPKYARFYILQSYINLDLLNNKFQSYFTLKIMKNISTSIQEEYYIIKTMKQIEVGMFEDDQKLDDTIDVIEVVKFQKVYEKLQIKLQESIHRHSDFWYELLETNPNISKLYQIGCSISQSVEDVTQLYEKIIKINPNHIHTLKVFGKYQSEVINNEILGEKIIDKAEQIKRALNGSNSINQIKQEDKFGGNSHSCIMTCSGEFTTLGKILSCNKKIEILGYDKYEIIGQNIIQLMPKIYADYHDDMMIRYLESSQSKVMGIQRDLMCLNKQGALVPCSILIKLYPKFNQGIRIVVFITKQANFQNNQYQMLINPINYQILGMSQNCQQLLGLPLALVYGNKYQSDDFTLDKIISDFQILQNKLETMDNSNQSTFVLTLNTNTISNQCQINMQNSDDEEGQSTQPLTKFFKIQCKIQLFSYLKFKVLLLNFKEFQESAQFDECCIKPEIKKYFLTKGKTKLDNAKSKIQDDQFRQQIIEEASSINSVQSSYNNELRKLKDAKLKLNSKKAPKIIRLVQALMLLLSLILLASSITDLIVKQYQLEQANMTVQFIHNTYTRTSEISNLLLYCQTLKLNVTQKQNMTKRLYALQQLQFELYKVQVEFAKYGISIPSLPPYNFTFMIEGQQYIVKLRLRDAIRELVIQIITFSNKLKDLNSYYFIKENGQQNLRKGTFQRNNDMRLYFENIFNNKSNTYLTIMIISIIMVILIHLIVLPILINIEKAINKVLSLFGIIEIADFKELIYKCQQFQQQYIEYKKEILNVDSQTKTKQIPITFQDQQISENNLIEFNNEEQDKQIISPDATILKFRDSQIIQKLHFFQQQKKKKKLNYSPQIQLNQEEIERVQKLEKNVRHKHQFTFYKIVIFFIIFTGFYSMQLVFEQFSIENMISILEHLRYCNQRSPIMIYRLIFGIQDVVDQQQTIIDEIWMASHYQDELYDAERNVFQDLQSFSLLGYDTYRKWYNTLNYYDICENLDILDDPLLDQTECNSVQNGILKKGLKTALINFALYANDTLRIGANISEVINGNPLQTLLIMLSYQDAAMHALNRAYLSDSKGYFQQNYQVEIVKFVLFIIGWIVLFIVIWTPYLNRLQKQIWQTKGMLNLIPLSLIQKNEKLKYKFLQDEVVKMVL